MGSIICFYQYKIGVQVNSAGLASTLVVKLPLYLPSSSELLEAESVAADVGHEGLPMYAA